MSAPAVDPELVLPVRHEAIARRVAELVTAELVPEMIPGTLMPGPMAPLWEWLASGYSGGRIDWLLNPFPVGPHVIQPRMTVDAGPRTIALQLVVDGGQPIWHGTLRDRRPSV